MLKNELTLSTSDIEKRKKELQSDLETIQSQMQNLEKMRVQLTAQGKAINGAIQQCDAFLQQLETNPVSSIPSKDDGASVKAAFS